MDHRKSVTETSSENLHMIDVSKPQDGVRTFRTGEREVPIKESKWLRILLRNSVPSSV